MTRCVAANSRAWAGAMIDVHIHLYDENQSKTMHLHLDATACVEPAVYVKGYKAILMVRQPNKQVLKVHIRGPQFCTWL